MVEHSPDTLKDAIMAKYVKTDYVPDDCDYITAKRLYKYMISDALGGFIEDDLGVERYIKASGSGDLNGRDWTVINR